MIEPHGKKLVNRFLDKREIERIRSQESEFKKIVVNRDVLLDLDNIATGVFSPLEGFVLRDDYHSIVHEMRLVNGLVWTIPVTFPVNEEQAAKIDEGEDVLLYSEENELIAVLHLEEKYSVNKHETATHVYGTTDLKHPGVKKLFEEGNVFLGGEIDLIKRPKPIIEGFRLDPSETRQLFKKRRWKSIAGFQTRNVPHRAHEYLQKAALEHVDGLLLHPLIGWKKKGDFKPEAIFRGYNALINNYFPKERVVLACLTTAMRYAGPREAVFHAIIRKNFGCTHFIVGRDHAGVGRYYGIYDAHKIFDEVGDIGITPMRLHGPYYCKRCGNVATDKTCPHKGEEKIEISGTYVRELIISKKKVPPEIMRPEVAECISHEDII